MIMKRVDLRDKNMNRERVTQEYKKYECQTSYRDL